MSFLAANPAGFSRLSSCPLESVNESLSTRSYGGELRPSYGGDSRSNRTAIAMNFPSQHPDENFVLAGACRYILRLLLGHSFEAFAAPGGTRSSASHCTPLWGLVPYKTSLRATAKYAVQTSFGPLAEINQIRYISAPVRLDESTASQVDQYAAFIHASADDVVDKVLNYVFSKDRDFQELHKTTQAKQAASTLRVRKAPSNGAAEQPPTKPTSGVEAASSARVMKA